MSKTDVPIYKCDICGDLTQSEYHLAQLDHLYLPIHAHVCKGCRSTVVKTLRLMGFELGITSQQGGVPERILVGDIDVQRVLKRENAL